MSSKHNSYSFLSLLLLTSLLYSCAPTQEIGNSIQDFERTRQDNIESYIKKQLAEDSSNYESIAFGQLMITKPPSFAALDSMYLLKTRLLQNKHENFERLKELEEEIQIKRLELQPEVGDIVYEQEHVYAIKHDSIINIKHDLVNLKNQLYVQEDFTLEENFIKKNFLIYYKRYFFNQSFVLPFVMQTTQEEVEFYQLFKSAYDKIIDQEEKDEFLNHTLSVMKKAELSRSLSSKQLIKEDIKTKLSGNFTIINFEVEELETGELVAYYCVVEQMKDGKSIFTEFRYDVYLRPMDFD